MSFEKGRTSLDRCMSASQWRGWMKTQSHVCKHFSACCLPPMLTCSTHKNHYVANYMAGTTLCFCLIWFIYLFSVYHRSSSARSHVSRWKGRSDYLWIKQMIGSIRFRTLVDRFRKNLPPLLARFSHSGSERLANEDVAVHRSLLWREFFRCRSAMHPRLWFRISVRTGC